MRNRTAFTLVEITLALTLGVLVIGITYQVFHVLMGGRSRSNLTGLMKASSIQKDARSGARRLHYRLREGIEILTPPPGTMAEELIFRDGTNTEVRVRRLPEENTIISERKEGDGWIRETEPRTVTTGAGKVPVSWPIIVPNCLAVHFTALSPSTVTVEASLTRDSQISPLLTVIQLRNSTIGY